MLIHTGDNHHVCPECDKRFTRAGDLKKTHVNSYRRKINIYFHNVTRGLHCLIFSRKDFIESLLVYAWYELNEK